MTGSAVINMAFGLSLYNKNDRIVPINGAVPKKALVRALPILRIASTNNTMLNP